MLLGRGEDVQSRSVSGTSPSLDIELFPESAKVLRLVIDNWEHPARKEKVARLYRLDIGTKRRRARAAGELDPDARTHCKGPLCRAAGRTTNPARWPLCPNLQQ